VIASVSPIGLVGRALAAVGAVLMGVSLFLDVAEGSSFSYWDEFRRIDVVILVLAAFALVLLALSFVSFEVACLFGVGVIGGFGIGFFSIYFIELSFDKGIGAWLANVGSALLLIGALVALLPAMARRAGRTHQPALLGADAAPTTPAPASTPATVTSSPAPGWYPDPSGRARLRYWDGRTWTEQTQA
jgi:hypothetical protein